jgi:hypothetical protein
MLRKEIGLLLLSRLLVGRTKPFEIIVSGDKIWVFQYDPDIKYEGFQYKNAESETKKV